MVLLTVEFQALWICIKAKTKDVLVTRAIPVTTGYSSVWSNIRIIDNKGIELELNTINLNGRLVWERS